MNQTNAEKIAQVRTRTGTSEPEAALALTENGWDVTAAIEHIRRKMPIRTPGGEWTTLEHQPDGTSAKWATLEYPGADAYTISGAVRSVQIIDDPIASAPGPFGGSRKQRRLAATKAIQRARRHGRALRRLLAKRVFFSRRTPVGGV